MEHPEVETGAEEANTQALVEETGFNPESAEFRAAAALKSFMSDDRDEDELFGGYDEEEDEDGYGLQGDDDQDAEPSIDDEEEGVSPEPEKTLAEPEAGVKPESSSNELLLRAELERAQQAIRELQERSEATEKAKPQFSVDGFRRNPGQALRELGLSKEEILTLGQSALVDALGDQAPEEYRQATVEQRFESRLEKEMQAMRDELARVRSEAYIAQYRSGLSEFLGTSDAEHVSTRYQADPKGAVEDLLRDAYQMEQETGRTPTYDDVVKYHNDKIANLLKKYQPQSTAKKAARSQTPSTEAPKAKKTITQSQASATPVRKKNLSEKDRLKRAAAAYMRK
jgi:hypothetical protein